MRRILVTGASGQIGTELVTALQNRYGKDQIISSDLRISTRLMADKAEVSDKLFESIDCTEISQIREAVRRYDVGMIYHLAAVLSAAAEEKPQEAWRVNLGGLYNVLEVARQYNCAVFFPSSIGAFGPSTPRDHTPQVTIQRPTTIYGITKVSGELLCDFYALKFGVDVRGLRLPGIISYAARPGGGTTDYAVEIFYQAIRYKYYSCYLGQDTCLDMMYMPDAIRAMIELSEADPTRLKHRNAYNVTAMSIKPGQLADEIRKHIPEFVIDYEIDEVRQAIADSWPRSIDDSAARAEWDWSSAYGLDAMTADMINQLKPRLTPTK